MNLEENVFDESGQTVAVAAAAAEETEVVETDVEAAAPEAAPEPGRTYRIGEKTFTNQDEALAYAQTLEAERQVLDAYQQGLRDSASAAVPGAQNVTQPAPAAPELNTEELYTNPQEFLRKYGNQIKSEAQAAIDAKLAQQAADEQIWREFTDRHPMLADFRSEVENFVAQNQADVMALVRTKGRPAALDHVAVQMKSRFARYADAVKTKRELPNTGSAAPQAARAGGVTPKPSAEKPLSFAEQIRSMKKRK